MAALHITRPWTFVTVPLEQLTLAWATRKSVESPVSIVPPSIGTLCIPPTVQQPSLQFGTLATGTTGSLVIDVTPFLNDKCNQAITPVITFPCTQLVAGQKTVNMTTTSTDASWLQTINPTYANATCTSVINDVLNIPCQKVQIGTVSTSLTHITGSFTMSTSSSPIGAAQCPATLINASLDLTSTGGGGISVGGTGAQPASVTLWPFLVGTSGSHSLNPSSACATSYPPGAVVPIFDSQGLMGTPGVQLNPATNTITNVSSTCMSDGDTVSLYADGSQSPTSPTVWSASV